MLTEEIRHRAALYALLSRLWLREVDAELLRQLSTSPLSELLSEMEGPVVANDEPLESLAEDYCRLFLGPTNHLPPVQSVWESGQFQGAAASGTQRYLDLLDPPLERPEGAMSDHLGVQLGIAARLLDGRADLHNPVQQAEIEQLFNAFASAHLAWATKAEMLVLVASRASTDFYRGLAHLTGEFLAAELS